MDLPAHHRSGKRKGRVTPKQKAIQALDAVRKEQARQLQFLGARLGVVDKLRELQRDERRLLRRIELMCGEASADLISGKQG
jgi:hypothetical protein